MALTRLNAASQLKTSVSDYTELKKLTPSAGFVAFTSGRSSVDDGGGGQFIFDDSDLSTEVAADTQGGIYVAPTSDATGASGAWVRQYNGAVNVRWFGAVGNGVVDDTSSIQNAIDVHQGRIYFPLGTYKITQSLIISYANIYLEGETKGTVGASVVIKYDGVSTSNAMINVQSNKHGFVIDGFDLNANLKADICLHINAVAGSATHHSVVTNVIVRGYNTRGIILGANDTVSNNNGQMQIVRMDRIYWQGGAASAIGLLVNAQNAEFVNGNGWYFDIEPTAYSNHSNHIFAKSGGINIQGLLSTRADSYAIFTGGSQVIVTGWRSEDRYLFDTAGLQLEGPCVLTGVLARYLFGDPADVALRFNGIDSVFVINGATVNGSVRIGATNNKYISIKGLQFTYPTSSVIYNSPQNWSGSINVANTGVTTERGSSPGVLFQGVDGTNHVGLFNGYLYTPVKTIDQFTSNQTGVVLPLGQFFRISADISREVQGVTPASGRNITFYNIGTPSITFKHLSGAASPINGQLSSVTGADIILATGEVLQLVFDVNNWIMWKV